jgi:hypothetical protein
MHYVKYTQKAIVSWLPKHGHGSTFLSSSRFSPQRHNHAVTLQTNLRYYQGTGSDGIGSAKVLPNGDDVLQLRNDAFLATGTTRDSNSPVSRLERREDGSQRIRTNRGISHSKQDWQNKSVEELLEELKNLASELRLRECDLLARYMIWQRGYKPNREMYMSLILANGSTDGSASTIRFLLDQMKNERISLGTAECLTVLKALATHPDYVLRTQIIQYMERGWHGLTEDTHHLIIAGMLRGLQLEQAVDELESMVRNGIGVATWLYDLTVAVLINVGELEEALRVLRMRLELVGPEELTPIWTFMLEAAAESFNVSILS